MNSEKYYKSKQSYINKIKNVSGIYAVVTQT
jgi:hypothetical protein